MKLNSGVLLVLSLLLLLLQTFNLASAQNNREIGQSCIMPDNYFGKCKKITDCPKLIEKLNNLTNETKVYLRKCSCGWFDHRKPVVCCPHDNYKLINSDTCGRATGSRIFHGTQTELSEFPWMALLGYRSANRGVTKSLKYDCGGSLITRRYVLTAAHCLTPTLRTVRLGEHDLRNVTDCEYLEDEEPDCAAPVQDINIKRQIKHPKYIPRNINYDIALLELETEADLSVGSVDTICLPVGAFKSKHLKKLLVAGWGRTENSSGQGSDVLLKVTLNVMKNDECNEVYMEKYQRAITDNHLCAGGGGTSSSTAGDSCSGDSGGPLSSIDLFSGSTRNIQFGVVCAGPVNCSTPGVPGIYTRVGSFMEWILDNVTPT